MEPRRTNSTQVGHRPKQSEEVTITTLSFGGNVVKKKRPPFRLVYFNLRGKAELIRLIFIASDIMFEDCRITTSDWTKLKPGAPWNSLPYLEIDGSRALGQCRTIARYVAREAGLAGRTLLEQAYVDAVAESTEDAITRVLPAKFEKDQKRKDRLIAENRQTVIPDILSTLQKNLKLNNGGLGFFVGNELTWADLAVFTLYDHLFLKDIGCQEGVLQNYPKLAAHRERIASLPRIAYWLQHRPVTEF